MNVEAAEPIDAERVGGIVIVFIRGEKRWKPSQVDGIEDGAEVDVEGLGPLAGKDFDTGGRVSVDTL